MKKKVNKYKKAGVNFIAYRCKLNSKEIKIEKKINRTILTNQIKKILKK